ncbi:putative SP-containing membrane protein [Vairimorpha necatrix]|uniref:SP-containing membrane protein n=1 Tax=Vairimorpha necatrix TaxID=6039 RepID=A0AAX4JCR1_9MICR
MSLVLIFNLVSCYVFEPRHALMITTKTSSTPYSYNSNLGHMRPYAEPLFVQRIHREVQPFAVEDDEVQKNDLDNSKFKRRFSEIFFSHSMVRLAMFSVACCLFFFIGYQTRKSQESNSYVRLPTTN